MAVRDFISRLSISKSEGTVDAAVLEHCIRDSLNQASMRRMAQVPGYDKSNYADDATFFHGREVRKVPNAAGGMNFVLQLSAVDDKDGWVAGERQEK